MKISNDLRLFYNLVFDMIVGVVIQNINILLLTQDYMRYLLDFHI